jgi:Putative transposase
VSDGCVQQLVQRIADRVLRALRKAGKWVDTDAAAEGGDAVGDELLPGLAAAAVEGRAALGARAGQRDVRIGREGRWEPPVKGSLCASIDGFSLHAGAWVSARDREKLEKLCRYAARPAVAESRLVELSDGRIGYALKKRWRDGTTAVVMTKAVLMERLCALLPKPRKHLVMYHGVLAPASGLRSRVVPRHVEKEGEAGGCQHRASGGGEVPESAEVAVAEAVENVAAAAFQRQQAERRVRARLRVPSGGGRRLGVTGRRACCSARFDVESHVLGSPLSAGRDPRLDGIGRVLCAIGAHPCFLATAIARSNSAPTAYRRVTRSSCAQERSAPPRSPPCAPGDHDGRIPVEGVAMKSMFVRSVFAVATSLHRGGVPA